MEAHLGAYRLLQRIGRGGMAEVFLGLKQGSFGFARRVVIKCLHDHLCGNPDAENRFVEEAQLGSLLEHGDIVPVLDLGISGGRLFMVMEYVDGLDLKTLLAGYGALPLPAVLHLGVSVSRGLHYAHRLKDPAGRPLHIVHRDVSPSNLLISRGGWAKLADFGVAKAEGREKTRAGVVKGKYAYMSPEQVEQRELDPRSDLFSLGSVLYEALTGERLFNGNSPLEIMDAVREASTDAVLNDLGPELEGVGQVLRRALARDRDQRFEDAAAMGHALADELLRLGATAPEEQLAEAVGGVLIAGDLVELQPGADSHSSTLDALAEEAAEVARHLSDESVTNHFRRHGASSADAEGEGNAPAQEREIDSTGLQPLPVDKAEPGAEAASESAVTSQYTLSGLKRRASAEITADDL